MNSKSPKTRIGVTGFYPELVGKVSVFDIDAFDREELNQVRRSKTDLIITAGHYFFSHSDPEVFRDRISVLVELCDEYQALACNLRLPPSFFEQGFRKYPLPRFLQLWNDQSSVPLVFDLPKESTLQNRKKLMNLSESKISMDPMWLRPGKAYSWKIHGWHDGRWVRLYSNSALEKLEAELRRWNPHFLIFAHSQRLKQCLHFLMLDESG